MVLLIWGHEYSTISIVELAGFMTLSLLTQVLYFFLFYLFVSATPGKIFFRLELRWLGNEADRIVLCLVRAICECFDLLLGPSLRVSALLRLDRRHLYDWLAQSIVVPTENSEVRIMSRRLILAALLFVFLLAESWVSTVQFFSQVIHL